MGFLQQVIFSESRGSGGLAEDVDRSCLGVDDPDDPGSRRQVLLDFFLKVFSGQLVTDMLLSDPGDPALPAKLGQGIQLVVRQINDSAHSHQMTTSFIILSSRKNRMQHV